MSIFTDQTPATLNANDGASITVGTWFKASESVDVSGIRWYFPTVSPSLSPIGALYDTSGLLLASVTFGSAILGDWNQVDLDAPVTLTPNVYYLAAVWTPDHYVATGGFFSTGPGSAGVLNEELYAPFDGEALHGGNSHNGVFEEPSGTGPAFPSNFFGGACYFADVALGTQEVPAEPGTLSVASTPSGRVATASAGPRLTVSTSGGRA